MGKNVVQGNYRVKEKGLNYNAMTVQVPVKLSWLHYNEVEPHFDLIDSFPERPSSSIVARSTLSPLPTTS